MKHITTLYGARSAAERAKRELIEFGIAEKDITLVEGDAAAVDRIGLKDGDTSAFRDAVAKGDVLLNAHVNDESEEVVAGIMKGAGTHSDADAGAEIAPAGKPLSAVGATSTIGVADDGRQTYEDPLEPREGGV